MILEPVRIIADWLTDAGPGNLGTVLALVPRDAGDPLPATPTVTDCTRDDQAAVQLAPLPAALPAVQVLAQDTGLIERGPYVSPQPADVQMEIVLRLVYGTADAATAMRDSGYVMRALRRSIRLLAQNDQSATRTRNGQHLISFMESRSVPVFTPVQDQMISGGIVLVCDVRDTWAAGLS
jgi:hypothetical protein